MPGAREFELMAHAEWGLFHSLPLLAAARAEERILAPALPLLVPFLPECQAGIHAEG